MKFTERKDSQAFMLKMANSGQHELVKTVAALAYEQGVGLTNVALKAGYAPATSTNIFSRSSSPKLQMIIDLLAVLGYELRIVPKSSGETSHAQGK